jgi:DNA-binding PadR family transcriptional regulator
MTLPTQLVLRELMEDPAREMYGLEVCAAAGLPSGTIHPILARLEKVGWLRSRWEEVDPAEQGRPRRRYYQLDPNAIALVRSALQRAEASSQALLRLRPGFTGGIQ